MTTLPEAARLALMVAAWGAVVGLVALIFRRYSYRLRWRLATFNLIAVLLGWAGVVVLLAALLSRYDGSATFVIVTGVVVAFALVPLGVGILIRNIEEPDPDDENGPDIFTTLPAKALALTAVMLVAGLGCWYQAGLGRRVEAVVLEVRCDPWGQRACHTAYKVSEAATGRDLGWAYCWQSKPSHGIGERVRIIVDRAGWVPSQPSDCLSAQTRTRFTQAGAVSSVLVLFWISARYRFTRARYEAWQERMNER